MSNEIIIKVDQRGTFHRTLVIKNGEAEIPEGTTCDQSHVPEVKWSKQLSSFTIDGKKCSYEEALTMLRQLQHAAPPSSD